jgi:uncharacterized DUF497 family protein
MEGAGVAFEYDPEKCAANLAKHGIDFEAAQALWRDERRTTLPSEYVGEERQLVVGRIRKTISAEEFDRLFDEGSDEIDQYIDWSSARRPGQEVERVNLDFPKSLVAKLDAEAERRGVTRQALIEMWLSERLDRAA